MKKLNTSLIGYLQQRKDTPDANVVQNNKLCNSVKKTASILVITIAGLTATGVTGVTHAEAGAARDTEQIINDIGTGNGARAIDKIWGIFSANKQKKVYEAERQARKDAQEAQELKNIAAREARERANAPTAVQIAEEKTNQMNQTAAAFQNRTDAEQRQLILLIDGLKIPLMSPDGLSDNSGNKDPYQIQNLDTIGNVIQGQNLKLAKKNPNIFKIDINENIELQNNVQNKINDGIRKARINSHNTGLTYEGQVYTDFVKLTSDSLYGPELTQPNNTKTANLSSPIQSLISIINLPTVTMTNIQGIRHTIQTQDLAKAQQNPEIFNIKNGAISVNEDVENGIYDALYQMGKKGNAYLYNTKTRAQFQEITREILHPPTKTASHNILKEKLSKDIAAALNPVIEHA